MTPEDIPAAIYKWGGPWPSKVAETDMSFDPVKNAVLLMWRLKPGVVTEQIIHGVDYKFVDFDGNEITREEWEVLDAQAKEERSRASAERDAASTTASSPGSGTASET